MTSSRAAPVWHVLKRQILVNIFALYEVGISDQQKLCVTLCILYAYPCIHGYNYLCLIFTVYLYDVSYAYVDGCMCTYVSMGVHTPM